MKKYSLDRLSSTDRFCELMEELRFQQYLSPAVLEAALEIHERSLPHAALLQQARSFFSAQACLVPQGLEHLPAIWLRRLPGILWSTRKPHWRMLPYFISSVAVENGILRLEYRQEQLLQSKRITVWDQLRVALNLSLKPNFWRPLSLPEEREIWDQRPDLREALLTVV